MSLRSKLVLALAVCTTLASVSVGALSYRATSTRLLKEVDLSLERATEGVFTERLGQTPRVVLEQAERTTGEVDLQLVDPDGRTLSGIGGVLLPVEDVDLEVASADVQGRRVLRTIVFEGEPTRMLTTSVGSAKGAVQAVRSLRERDRVLAALRRRILMVSAAVASVAAALGWLIARQITARLRAVTAAAERVAGTGDLEVAVPVEGADEAARLGTAFNEMVGALARSREDQRRLVQDAGHELRTPMTSLRTNMYALRSFDSLSEDQRGRVLADLESETEELSRLIDEVVEVATDRRDDEPVTSVDLADLVTRVAARTTARTGRPIVVAAQPTTVPGRPAALRRAVGNLIENAAKFDTSGAPVEVTVGGGRVEVTDRGPGFDDADLPHVFQRFYRSEAARSAPGSGLGLAIVSEIVAAHGGRVWAANREGGGAVVGFWLPGW